MNPSKLKELIPKIAHLAGVSVDEASLTCNAYWQRVRAMATSMEHLNIEMPGLGILHTRYVPLKKDLDTLNSKISVRESQNKGAGAAHEDLIRRRDKYQNLMDMHDEQHARLMETRANRKKINDEHPGTHLA